VCSDFAPGTRRPSAGRRSRVRAGALPLDSMPSKGAVTRQPGVCVSSATARPWYLRHREGPARAAVKPLPLTFGSRRGRRPPVPRSAQCHRRCSATGTVWRARAPRGRSRAMTNHSDACVCRLRRGQTLVHASMKASRPAASGDLWAA
jgi:hypothetical protein